MLHKFSSPKVEGGDSTIVGPNEWNDTHVHGTRSISANTAGLATDDQVFAAGGAGGINYTLPSPARTGQPIYVTKSDVAAGSVTVLPNGSEKIKSKNNLTGTSYVLVTPGQTAKFVTDGTDWWVTVTN
jgi:hypothetical protein